MRGIDPVKIDDLDVADADQSQGCCMSCLRADSGCGGRSQLAEVFLAVETEEDPVPRSAGATSALASGSLRDWQSLEHIHVEAGVVDHLPGQPCVDDIHDVGDRQTRLGNVGRDDTLSVRA